MANSEKKKKKKKKASVGDWKHYVRFGAIVAAVGGVLLVGAILQGEDDLKDGSPPRAFVEFQSEPRPIDDARAGDARDAENAREGVDPAGGAPVELYADEAAPVEEPEIAQENHHIAATHLPTSTLDQLASRADRDGGRLAAQEGWTLQFMMACDPGNVAPRVTAIGNRDDFYLLPTWFDSRPCFRLCWGSYPSKEAAHAAGGFPGALLEITDSPQPLPIEQALR